MNKRTSYRILLNELYVPVYDEICDNLPDYFQPISALRTFKEQDDLYAKGRTKAGIVVTRARGGMSAHNYGCATDWCIFDNGFPIWDVRDPRWAEYEHACAKAGALWGGQFNTPDYPHNELALTVPWKEVLLVYQEHGVDASQEFIKSRRI